MFYAFILFFILYDSFLSEFFLNLSLYALRSGVLPYDLHKLCSEWLLKTLLLRRETLTHVKKVNL